MASMPDPPPPTRAPTHARVEEWLGEHIRANDVRIGERLPTERDIAASCGVSRATVRQALAALQARGVVRVRHGDGCYLVRYPEDQRALASLLTRQRPLSEVLEARGALEMTIARLAAERRTPDDLRAIAAALDHMVRQVERGGPGFDGDRRFHEAVATAAHNPLMAELLDHLSGDLVRVRNVSLTTPGRPERSIRQHRAIAEAIERGDAAGAEQATREHLDSIVDLVVDEPTAAP
jgi:GntR family transcriptional regulator, transcriptional repressor for pyruvate dehydrogenase complex